MQRIKNVLFAFGISVIFIANVGAASVCTNAEQAELRTAAGNIRATYEETEHIIDLNELDPTYEGERPENNIAKEYYLKVNVTNLTDKFYASIENDYNKDKKTYNFNDTDNGILSFEWTDVDKIVTFTIKIYSSDKTGCANELYRTITLRVPRFNSEYMSSACIKYPKFELCQRWVMFNEMQETDFLDKVEKYVNKLEEEQGLEYNNKSFWERVKEFVSNNKYYFIGGGATLIIATGVAVVVIVKRKRSMDL